MKQSIEQLEMGCLKDVHGNPYTEENYPFVFDCVPYHPFKLICKWKTICGQKTQEFDHEETDYSRYEADDGSYIDFGFCRTCKKQIKEYSETYYKKVFEYNHWTNFRINQKSGYCKECAIKKATIENHGWNPSISVVSCLNHAEDNEHVEIKHMEDGSIIEEMTTKQKWRN